MPNPSESFDADPLERIADEFIARLRRGELPSVEEYARDHPELEAQIRKLFPTLARLEGLKPGADDTTLEADVASVSEELPERIGDYRIHREIGRGGMGVVYEAQQESLGRRVALKVLPGSLARSADARERFLREARAAAGLHHTNIVGVFEVGSTEGINFYAMQLIRGHGLDRVAEEIRRIRSTNGEQEIPASSQTQPFTGAQQVAHSMHTGQYQMPPPGSDSSPVPASDSELIGLGTSSDASRSGTRNYHGSVARIGYQVSSALDHAHARGIIHRDIKPSNLLLDGTGNVWVTDFGLAKTEDVDLTRTGDVVGTLRYMSPERFSGHCDVSSDVYAVGATLYELLTLKPAFDSRSRLELVDQIRSHAPTPPRALDPRIPMDLETIVLRSMSKEPRHRYPSALALADDLDRFLHDRPIQARRVSAAEHLWRWARRNRSLAASLGGVFLLLVSMSIVFALGRQNERALRGEQAEALYRAEMILAGRASESVLGFHEVSRLTPGWNPATAEFDLAGWEWHHLDALAHEEVLHRQGPDLGVVVCWTPDGKGLVTGGADHVSLTDFQSGELVWRSNDEGGRHRHVHVTPDGATVLSVTLRGELFVRDAKTGDLQQKLSVAHEVQTVSHAAVHSGSGLLAVSYHGRAGTALFDLNAAARPVRHFPETYGCGFSADGGQLIGIHAPSGQPTDIVFWETSSWDELRRLPFSAKGRRDHIHWSPDGELLALGGRLGALILHSQAGKPAMQCDAPTRHASTQTNINCMAWNRTGDVLATGARDGVVRLWKAETGEEFRRFPGNDSEVLGIAWSPDGRWLAATTENQALRVWDGESDAPSIDIAAGVHLNPNAPVHLNWLEKDRGLLIGQNSSWLVQTETRTSTHIKYRGPRSTALDGGEQGILAWGMKGFHLCSPGGDVLATQPIPGPTEGRGLIGAAWHEDHPWIYALNRAGELWRFDRNLQNAPTRQGTGLWNVIYSIALDAKRSQIVVGTRRAITWYDAETGAQIRELKTQAAYWSIRFSADGDQIAVAGEAAAVSILDAGTGDITRQLVGHAHAALAAVFHPDGSRIATGGRDQTVRLWEPHTGELVTVFDEGEVVRGLAWSPDGKQLATLLEDGTVRVRRAPGYEPDR